MSRRKPPKPKTNAQGEVVHAINVRNVVHPIWKRWAKLVMIEDQHIGPELTTLLRADIAQRESKNKGREQG